MSISPKVPLIVGVTGHRDLVNTELPQVRARVAALLSDLQSQFPGLPMCVLHGAAEGADRLVADVALAMGCRVINVLPMPKVLYATNFSGASLDAFNHLCKQGETIELPLCEGVSEQAVGEGGPGRDQQYARVGSFIAAHCHILLALWDGHYNQAVGGTSYVVDFHRRDFELAEGSEVARSQLDVIEDESDLVYHVVCSRQQNGRPAGDLVAGDGWWFTRDDVQPRVQTLPQRYRTVFDRMSRFNADTDTVQQGQGWPLEPAKTSADDAAIWGVVQEVYRASDVLATRFQKRMMYALRATLSATLLAGLAFVAYADFAGQSHMIWFYLAFVAVALLSYLVAQRMDWQRRYLDYRVLAEALRVQYYWALAGVEMNDPGRFSHDSFFQGRDLQLGWIRNVMRWTGLFVDARFASAPDDLDRAIQHWVGDDESGQLGYYRIKAKEKLQKHTVTQRISIVSFVGGISAALVLALLTDHLSDLMNNTLVALMGALPIFVAVRQTYAHRMAARELVAQYASMRAVFAGAQRRLQKLDTVADRQQVLRDLGEAALNENAQWVLRQRERPLPGGEAVG